MIEKWTPEDIIHAQDNHKYLLITNGTELILRCVGHQEQNKRLTAGVYELELNYPCSLHSKNWTLLSTFQHVLYGNLRSDPSLIHANLSITHLFQTNYQANSLLLDSTYMSAVDRKLITVNDDLLKPINPLYPTSYTRYFWHFF